MLIIGINVNYFVIILASPEPFTNSPTLYNESDSAVLLCTSEASPSPAAIFWRRNGEAASNDLTLRWDPIQRSDAGVYECCYVTSDGSTTLCVNVTITVQCELCTLYVCVRGCVCSVCVCVCVCCGVRHCVEGTMTKIVHIKNN